MGPGNQVIMLPSIKRYLYMHASSLENMAILYNELILGEFINGRDRIVVLDIGGANVNGSYRDIFTNKKISYVAADLAANEGVDIVLHDPYRIPVPDGTFDLVISGQTFEHCEFFWLAFREMVRVVKDDGFVFLIAPSAGAIHRYPVDCYRFYPDSYAALAKYAKCYLERCWRDERGPWNDLVGVFRKHFPVATLCDQRASEPVKRSVVGPLAVTVPADPADGSIPPGAPEEEVTSGAEHYLTTLARIHEALHPGLYLEIGVRSGDSLRLAPQAAIGVDPNMRLAGSVPTTTALYHMTSDEFFRRDADDAIGRPVSLALIDGLHLFEYTLRDFMNTERRASRCGLIVADDIFPNHAVQGSRFRRTRVWAGDVWRLLHCLSEQRPDLLLLPLDCSPTGLLLIAGLDPDNRTLWDRYNPVIRGALSDSDDAPPPAQVSRAGALSPKDPIVFDLLKGLRRLEDEGGNAEVVRSFCNEFRNRYRYRPAC
jgi:SAM-dependent methyltransferase